MRVLTAVRSSGALWFVPVVFAIGMVLALRDNSFPASYVVSAISLDSVGVAVSGPLLAGLTALTFRGRARFHGTLRARRTGLTSLLAATWPLLLGAPVAACAAILLSVRTFPTDAVSWQMLAVDFVVMVACAALGVGFGWAFPSVVAVPAAAVLSFFWINYLPTYRYPTLHYLAPSLVGYSQGTRPDPLGIVAVATLAGLVTAGIGLCLARWDWWRTSRPVAGLLSMLIPTLAVAASVGVLRASDQPLNLQVAVPRTTDLKCEAREGVEICLWPEAVERVEAIAKLAATTNKVLGEWGLPPITTIAQGELREGAVSANFEPSSTPSRLQFSLATGYLRARLGCEEVPGPASEVRVALVAHAGGVSRVELEEEFSPETLATMDRALTGSTSSKEVGVQYLAGLADIGCLPSP